MNPLLINKNIDLVDFDSIRLFMFKNDNLYNNSVDKAKKNIKIDSIYSSIQEKNNINDSFLTSKNPRNAVLYFLNHLINNKLDFKVFDIGAHVGDFGLKCAMFFKINNHNIKTITFDPSPAGQLVEYNIKINDLVDFVKHENLALSTYNGLHLFKYKDGFSDSAKISMVKNRSFISNLILYLKSDLLFLLKTAYRLFKGIWNKKPKEYDFIVEGQTFQTYLKYNNINSDLFLKIDIEGFDKILIQDILKYKIENNKIISIITELGYDEDSIEYLNMLSNEFYIYDLFYCPNPTRFQKIEPNNIEKFVKKELSNRIYGYTDIFLLDKKTPNIESLMLKFSTYDILKDEYKLT